MDVYDDLGNRKIAQIVIGGLLFIAVFGIAIGVSLDSEPTYNRGLIIFIGASMLGLPSLGCLCFGLGLHNYIISRSSHRKRIVRLKRIVPELSVDGEDIEIVAEVLRIVDNL